MSLAETAVTAVRIPPGTEAVGVIVQAVPL